MTNARDTIEDLLALAPRQSSMRDFRRAIRGCVNKPVLYHARDGYGAALMPMLEGIARGERVHDSRLQEMFARGPSIIHGRNGAKGVGIVSMRGVALYDVDLPPLCYSNVTAAREITQLAADPSIETVVLDIDSPGGECSGTPELANSVWNARKRKNVVAIVNPLCASAAYWAASQATSIVACGVSASCGSVGVFLAHTDCSEFNRQQGIAVRYIYFGEHKIEGNPNQPLSDETAKYFQSEVDAIGRDFHKAVARGRGTTVADVAANFGRGRCMTASDALKAGLIDHIAASPDAAFQLAVSPSAMRAGRLAQLASASPHTSSGPVAARQRRLRLERLRD
jgi:signal peptide peptidase SppA